MWAFAFIALLNTKNFALAAVAVVVGLVLHGAMYGPQAAFLSELFGTTVRYSGVSIGYQLASILAGGLAPIIAVALLATFQHRLRDRRLRRAGGRWSPSWPWPRTPRRASVTSPRTRR